jgi:hypothetical protein
VALGLGRQRRALGIRDVNHSYSRRPTRASRLIRRAELEFPDQDSLPRLALIASLAVKSILPASKVSILATGKHRAARVMSGAPCCSSRRPMLDAWRNPEPDNCLSEASDP